MATVRQAKSGYWQAIVRRKGYPAQSKTFDRKADAELWAVTLESEMGRGLFISRSAAESTTLKELAADYKTEFAPHHYRGKAWQYKLAALINKLGRYSLVALTPQVVAAYRDARLKDPDPRYKRDLAKAPRISGGTVKTELDLLSKLLDWAAKEKGIALPTGNPVAGVRKPSGGKARDRRLTKSEWQALEHECKASKNPWLMAAVTLALETAMRQGELLGLLWRDLDKSRRVAMLKETKNGDQRAVPLTSRALTVLETLPHSIDGRVIPIDRMTLYTAFGRAVERAGITDYTWHDLRHEAISRLAERGDLSMLELAAVSGHKTLQMLRRYTHLQAEDLARKLG